MTKIYIITSGEYSDYHIHGVFDNENIAKLFTEKFGGNIETWELNPSEELIREGWNIYRVGMTKEGNTEYIDKDNDWFALSELQNIKNIGFNYDFPFNIPLNKKILNTWVLTKNEKHAIKITNERRIRLLAEDLWE